MGVSKIILTHLRHVIAIILVAVMRGFMTARGLPDNPRSSRHILKDFVQGKLLYCHSPPNIDPIEFQEHVTSRKSKPDKTAAAPTPFQLKVTKVFLKIDP